MGTNDLISMLGVYNHMPHMFVCKYEWLDFVSFKL
jgi:hypothetical protein